MQPLLYLALFVSACKSSRPRLDRLSRLLNEAAQEDSLLGPPVRKYGVPVFSYNDPDAAAAMSVLMSRDSPFVLQDAPGMASANVKWTPEYLKEALGRGTQMHWFDGEYFRNSLLLYSVSPLSASDASTWWEAWGSNTTLAAQAARQKSMADNDGSSRHSMYLQATAASAPFINADLELFRMTNRENSSIYASPLIGDPSVSAITVPECRFGLPGTRIEVSRTL